MYSSVPDPCITKLDALDEFDLIRVYIGNRIGAEVVAEPPLSLEGDAGLEPVYDNLRG